MTLSTILLIAAASIIYSSVFVFIGWTVRAVRKDEARQSTEKASAASR